MDAGLVAVGIRRLNELLEDDIDAKKKKENVSRSLALHCRPPIYPCRSMIDALLSTREAECLLSICAKEFSARRHSNVGSFWLRRGSSLLLLFIDWLCASPRMRTHPEPVVFCLIHRNRGDCSCSRLCVRHGISPGKDI